MRLLVFSQEEMSVNSITKKERLFEKPFVWFVSDALAFRYNHSLYRYERDVFSVIGNTTGGFFQIIETPERLHRRCRTPYFYSFSTENIQVLKKGYTDNPWEALKIMMLL